MSIDITVKINGSYVTFSTKAQKPVIQNNRVLVPLRAVFEKLGFTVGWTPGEGENPKGTATAEKVLTNGKHTVIVKEGETTYITDKDTHNHPNGVPVQIIGASLMLPLRGVFESVGCWVDWDDELKIVSVISIDKMLDNFKKDTTYQNKYSSIVGNPKKTTLVAIGQALASYGYSPSLIAGFLGHITPEGFIGGFEKDWGSAYQHYLRDWTSVPNLGLPNYTTEYSGKYIMDKNISTVQSILTTLENNEWPKRFGLGCCQWTAERTPILVNRYYVKSGNSITYDEAVEVEAQLIHDELRGVLPKYDFRDVINKWKAICFKENISLSSDDAAYWAGFCVLLGYGYNPIHLDPNKPAPYLGTAQAQSWVSEAILRGGYARDVYKVMIGKSII